MQYRDLRDFISGLEKRGELKRIQVPVSPKLEMTEICDRTLRAKGPALLFENPIGHDIPVLGNLFKTQKRGNNKTELVLMIVPYIIESDGQAEELTRSLSQRFELLELPRSGQPPVPVMPSEPVQQ